MTSYLELYRVCFYGWGLVVCLGGVGRVFLGGCSFGGGGFLVFSLCLFVSSCG